MSSLKYKYGETIKLNKELINIACCCYDLTFFLDKDRMITAVAGAIKLKLPRRIPTAKYFSRIPREEADPDRLHA